jgi:ATP-dependent DNA helicase RecG
MTLDQLQSCISAIRQLKCDTDALEAKSAVSALPQHLWKTLSAFSNTRGGTIILGLAEDSGEPVGVKNPAKMQQDLGSMCSDMEPIIRPQIQSHRLNGKSLVTAEVAELDARIKPCYYKSAGYTNGAFVRVSDGNRKLSQYEVHMMLSGRGQPKDDEAPVPGTSLDDLQPRLLKGFLSRLRRRPNGYFAKLSDEKILRTVKVLVPTPKGYACSLAGLLALGKYPQQLFPALGITFVAYPGTIIGEPGERQERFMDNERIDGPVPTMLGTALRALQRNMKTRSVVRGLYREDVDEYPTIAVRETVVNALAHRDLSPWGQGTPIQMQLFSDRFTIHNPGGLYGPVTVESLGREGISASRNLLLLQILEDTPISGRNVVCENRGSGVGAMLEALRKVGLRDAEFEDKIATFRVTIFNAPLSERRDRRGEILSLLRDGGDLSTGEIARHLNLSPVGVRKWLATLRKEGLVNRTEAKARSKNIRHRLSQGIASKNAAPRR